MVSNANTKWAGDKRVYVVDEASGVFVFDLLTSTECDDIVAGAEKHISTVGNDSSKNWRKLLAETFVAGICCSRRNTAARTC